ncbi:DNA-processing protein DprA [Calidifontimicrobium sp. SYSU G02091]|uniref:DNA-processing protein DprA n=1 Tax=Calidifontimicrobium sp. SYSU G02091 TaxID=2926421 RepID=UPI001F53AF54|nr:DNA-processing protein DprA [Calidifontimicrobium sp. SYSU G02091]MCI1190920.1 DNA-processing protein DprA [Calidifontimicrobium sp. SYSU G02091]
MAGVDDELAAWLRLLLSPGVGRDAARRLLAAFGSPQAVFVASTTARRAVVPPSLAEALAAPPESWQAQCDATAAWLAGDGTRRVVTLGDALYPPALLHTADPPLLLFVHGRAELLAARDALAIVGSRNPTAQGRDNARAFAAHFARAGWTVVSGLALGIDGAAHEGALEGGGDTVAVMGTGIDRVYPARHRELAHRIARDGALVSEFPLGTPPLAGHFPQRNRLIAGLARGTLVVEAALESGSLITARLAAEAGREVFAIPGSIHSPQSRGCHALIKQGAKLVETADDVLGEFGSARGAPAATPAPAPRDPVLDALGHDPATLDALAARTGWPAADLAARLLELELEGHVQRLPGGMYQRRERA